MHELTGKSFVQINSVKLKSKYKIFIQEQTLEHVVYKTAVIRFRFQCINIYNAFNSLLITLNMMRVIFISEIICFQMGCHLSPRLLISISIMYVYNVMI